jgi:hypothetical protein
MSMLSHRGHDLQTGSITIAKLVSRLISLRLCVLFFAVNLPGVILIDQGIIKCSDVAAVERVTDLACACRIVNVAHRAVVHGSRFEVGGELRFGFLGLGRG